MSEKDEEEFRAGFYGEGFKRFDELGAPAVAAMLSRGEIPPADREAALIWLGNRDRSSIAIQAASLAASEATASATRQQAASARRANIIAIIAMAIAIASAVKTIVVPMLMCRR